MAVNPKYKQLAKEAGGGTSGTDERNLPIFDWKAVGDVITGTITYVGDFFEQPNKFYRAAETLYDKDGKEVHKPAQGQEKITKQKVIVETRSGEKFAIYFSKKGHWDAIDAGLTIADGVDDLVAGVRFRGERVENDDKAHQFDFKFKPAS